MLRALRRLLGLAAADPRQLALPLDTAPRTADELLANLRMHGLSCIDRCRLTRNRAVMVSYRGAELRVHEGYLSAPPDVLRAVVLFVEGRTRAERAAARRTLLGFRVPAPETTAPVRRSRTLPEDEPIAQKLAEWHLRLNEQHFGGTLASVPIRVSRRMRRRLGHYTAAGSSGEPAEIAISRSHVRRHGWGEALQTLMHEMVHQWQDEQGHPIDHGTRFRARARELGIAPYACREVGSRAPSSAPTHGTVGLRAACSDGGPCMRLHHDSPGLQS